MNPLRLIFFGTADLACPSLAALTGQQDLAVHLVVTQPDRPKGRDLKVQPPPVKVEALARGLPVRQPERARSETFVAELAQLRPDLIAVAAYGQILPTSILDLPRFGCLNVHTSMLPRYRGAAPIQWAILNDEAETGVTIMKMDAGLDTGDILTQESVPIAPSDNAQTLHDRLAQLGAELLVRTISEFVAGRITPRRQVEADATYARKITKEDGRLDWSQPARALWNRIRAFTPWPGAFTFLPGEGRQPMLRIWSAAVTEAAAGSPGEILLADRTGIVVRCGEGALRVAQLQREGGRRMTAREFLAGHCLGVGERLP